jgi:hypothetical protein
MTGFMTYDVPMPIQVTNRLRTSRGEGVRPCAREAKAVDK